MSPPLSPVPGPKSQLSPLVYPRRDLLSEPSDKGPSTAGLASMTPSREPLLMAAENHSHTGLHLPPFAHFPTTGSDLHKSELRVDRPFGTGFAQPPQVPQASESIAAAAPPSVSSAQANGNSGAFAATLPHLQYCSVALLPALPTPSAPATPGNNLYGGASTQATSGPIQVPLPPVQQPLQQVHTTLPSPLPSPGAPGGSSVANVASANGDSAPSGPVSHIVLPPLCRGIFSLPPMQPQRTYVTPMSAPPTLPQMLPQPSSQPVLALPPHLAHLAVGPPQSAQPQTAPLLQPLHVPTMPTQTFPLGAPTAVGNAQLVNGQPQQFSGSSQRPQAVPFGQSAAVPNGVPNGAALAASPPPTLVQGSMPTTPVRHVMNDARSPTSCPPITARPYVCRYKGCGRSFARSSDLRRHIRSHEQPLFHCPYWEVDSSCHRNGGAFNRLDVVKRHLKLVHFSQANTGEAGWCKMCNRPQRNVAEFIEHTDACAAELRARTSGDGKIKSESSSPTSQPRSPDFRKH